jgi:predicted permease
LEIETANWEKHLGDYRACFAVGGPTVIMPEWWARILSRVRGLFSQAKADRELSDEIETHVELLAERFVIRGMSPTEALLAARRQFGNSTLLKQRHRETRTFLWLATVGQDIRFAIRVLKKRPGITAISVTSLALGIGANTAIFTLAKAALFDALSVPHPEQLRLLAYAQDDRSEIRGHTWGDFYVDAQGRTVLASFSWLAYQELLHKNHSLGELFAFVDLTQFEHLSATIDGHAEVVSAELVSGNFFQGMGIGSALGRPIEPVDDAVPGSGAVAVISDSLWTRQFNRSPLVIGKTMDVNLIPVTIIGVAPPGFTGASSVQHSQDLFMPLSMQPVIFPQKKGSLLTDRETWWIQVMGRLQPNTPIEQARASLAVSFDQAIQSTMTVAKGQTIPPLLLLPGGRGWNYAAQELEHPMPLLLALAGLVLLLACVNVANVLLAQSSSRSREISVRMALGAGKMRVARQLLTECLCLSLMGGAGGLLLGYLGRSILPRLFSSSWGPVALQTRFDWRVFAFTLAISVFTGIGFGVGPSWQAAHAGVNQGLKDGGTASRRRKGLAGKGLIIAQVALCTLLLVSAGLFVRTFASLTRLNPGFNKKGLLLFAVEPPQQRYPAPKDAEVLHRIEERVATVPGVESASLSREALLAQSGSNSDFMPVGRPLDPSRERYIAFNSVGQSFFKTMGISILNGRPFDDHDRSTSPTVAVINRALSQKEFPGMNPIGSSFRMKEGGVPIEVVGVCADSKYAWIRQDDPPAFFVLYMQQKDVSGGMTFEIRTNGNPRNLVPAIRQVVESVDKDLPLIEIRTQQEQIDATLAPERSFASVTTGFGVLALLLASIGIYGVMAAAVSRRINEIGVRMALGARANEVLRMVLGEATVLALAGVCVGLLAAFWLTRFLASFLYGLKPTDSFTFIGSGILLWIVALAASWSPARRASHIQPVQALRHE